ncbi:MAG: FimV/HubP family polar landmark protein, partial [Lysobacterales bacterium]
MINRISRLTLGVLCALGCGQAAAMGLGPIEVRSGLNQPLLADIPILSEGENVDELRAQLANPEDLRRVGIDTSALSVPLDFEVVEDSRGRPIIRVTSTEPVREPYLSFLVEANWGKGRLLREYSVLLDPPVFAPAVIERVAPPVSTSVAPVVSVPRPVAPPVQSATPPRPVAPSRPAPAPTPAPMMAKPAEPAPPPAPRAAPPPAEPMLTAPAPRSDSYAVQAGDTLYEIAAERRADANASINQMMVAMLRANPSAFYKDNINALKKGAVLRIPDATSARELSAAAAAAEVAAQVRAWSGTDTPALVADAGTPAPAPARSTRKPATAAEPAPAPRGDRLALVPPKAGTTSQSGTTRAGTAGGTGAAEAAELRSDLVRTREQLSSREQEAVELRSRVKGLEKIGGESKRLIELKNNEIAALKEQLKQQEKRLIDAQQAAVAARAAAVKAGTPAATIAEAPRPIKTSPTPPVAEPIVTAVTDPVAAPVTPATANPAAIDPMTGQPFAAGTAASGAAADPDIVVDPASESAVATASTPPTLSTAADDAVVPVNATATPTEVPERAARPWYLNPYLGIGAIVLAILGLLAVFGRRRPPEVLEVTELSRPSVANEFSSGVLPSAPSPVAAPAPYGATLAAPILGDDVLERALLDRRASDPENLEHHLDVLRHYHELRDDERFIEAASSMRNHVVDPEHYAWLEAQELGRDIDAMHPLFAATTVATATPDDDYEFRPSAGEPPTPVAWQPAVTVSASAPVDLGDDDWDQPRSPPVAVPTMDRDDYSVSTPVVERPEIDAPELVHYQFDELPEAPRSASSPVLGEDAVATKLDLARAYIDMGDSDGARAMLQEVLAEGSGAQQ